MAKKAITRRERSYPKAYRVFSTNYLENMLNHPNKCFVPYEDVLILQDKYLKLFKRYQRERLCQMLK